MLLRFTIVCGTSCTAIVLVPSSAPKPRLLDSWMDGGGQQTSSYEVQLVSFQHCLMAPALLGLVL